ncbi:MAG: hypothetical protein RMM58_02760 [Chloroflexota bacterium]|nr:hypothetical protein [Dehalococcoidia bacterium]MDW8252778.1 hypothetical protein [Chloroflexota bacterium]
MTVTTPAAASLLRDQFRLVGVVGSTESADAYWAVDRQTGEDALIQVIRPGATANAAVRADLLARLAAAVGVRRPDIVPIREVGCDDDRIVIVCERPLGLPLTAVLARGPSPLAWSAGVVRDALRAVEAARSAAVAHPGLSPANIFVAPDGQVQVAERGLPLLPPAAVLPGIGGRACAVAAAVRAPELVAGQSADRAAQQYAAAALFVWLVSGAPPVTNPNDSLAERQARLSGALAAARVPEAFIATLARSLALSPAERRRAFGALIKGLDALRGAPSSAVRRGWARRWLWFGGAVAAVAGAAAFLLAGSLPAARALDDPAGQPGSRSAIAASSQHGTGTFAHAPLAAAAPAETALGRAHTCWGRDWPCAIDALQELAALQPDDRAIAAQLASAYVSYGQALAEVGEISAAADAFRAALALRPDDPAALRGSELAAHVLAGQAAYDAADWPTAVRAFGHATAIDPTFGEARRLLTASLINWGWSALRRGERQQAALLCGEAQRLGGAADACLASLQTSAAPRPRPTVVSAQPPAGSAPPSPSTAVVVRTQNTPRHRTTWLP